MNLNTSQIEEINNIFSRAEKFITNPTRTPIFDISYIKIKGKILLGFHLELYTRQDKKPKHVDIEFWIGELKDLKKETIKLFLENFEYTEKNGLVIKNLKVNDVKKYKLQLLDIVSKNV